MDKVQKILAAAPKLKRDSMFRATEDAPSSKESVSTTPSPEREPDQRKLPEEKITNLYPIRLQIPIDQQQNLILTEVAGLRRVANINKGSVIRALINLLEKVQFTDADRVSSEEDLENLLRTKLKGI